MSENTHSANKPLVSVIVLTYCQENTIARTLDSILAQRTDFKYEILIGEDASTDGTRAICQEYARLNPDVVRLMPKADNKGVVRNYFDTLNECRGDFVADCAGDDFWCDEDKLQKQVDVLTKCPDVSVVHTGWYRYDENTGTKAYVETGVTGSTDYVRSIALQTTIPIIHLCTALYRKDIVAEAVKADHNLFLSPHLKCEDLQVAYVLAKAGKVAYLPHPTLCYSIGHESVSNEGDELKLFRFFLSATDLSHMIVCREELTGGDVDTYFQKRIFALLMHLLRASNSSPNTTILNGIEEIKQHAALWQQPMSLKNRLLASCIKNHTLRHLLLALRWSIIRLKSLCR